LKEFISDDNKSKGIMITPEKLEKFINIPDVTVIARPKMLTNNDEAGE